MKKLLSMSQFFRRKRISLLLIATMALSIIHSTTVHARNNMLYAQNQRINLQLNNASMEEVLEKIKEQSEFNFLYRSDILLEDKNLDVKYENSTLDIILNEVFVPKGFRYNIKDKVVVIRKGKNTATPKAAAKPQQKLITYTGKVVDESGNPIPFAAVVIKGTTIGVATEQDGSFELTAIKGNYKELVASSIGLISHQIEIGDNTNFTFVLRTDVAGLDEVMVTGYASISSERATGAFDKVSVSQIDKPASSIAERLQGAMAGVQTTVSEDGGIDFEIRGQSSLLADAQPLIVIDGFPMVQTNIDEYNFSFKVDPFENINPNDVESITVLKDAAAASIWGAKSANGVIVITTKNARKGKAQIEFSSFMRYSPKYDLDYINPSASSAETIEYERLGFDSNSFGGGGYWAPSYSTGKAGSPQSQVLVALYSEQFGLITEQEMEDELTRLSGLDNRDQIRDNLMRNPFTQQYNLSISGGNKFMSNNLSLMYENRKDGFQENNEDKAIVNFRNQIEMTKWLDFSFSGMMKYAKEKKNGVSKYGTYGDSYPEITQLSPYDMLINEDGSYNNLNHVHYFTPVLNNLVPTESFPHSDWSYNPIQEIQNQDLSTTELTSRVQLGLTFKLLKGLTVNSKFLYQHMSRDNKTIYDAESFTMRQMINETSSWDQYGTGAITQNMPYGGGLIQNSNTVTTTNFRNQLNFVRSFGENHAINFVAGSEVSSEVWEYKSEPDVIGYNDETLSVGRLLSDYSSSTKMWTMSPITYAAYYYPISLDPTFSFRHQTDRYFSLFGNLAYTFKDKYTVTGSVRTDASNLITDDPTYRYSPFWSVGGSWQLAKENFLRDKDWIDRLTLRGTFGYSGNVDRSTSFKPLLNISSTANIYTNENTASIGSHGNPTLRWEKTQSLDIGIDYAFGNSKFFGSIDYYHKQGEDLIVDQTIASVNGSSSQKFNNGEMVNKGVEVKVGTSVPLNGNKITWYGNVNFSYNKNEITSLYIPTYSQYGLYAGGTTAYSEGKDANTIWAYEYAGVQNTGTEQDPNMTPVVEGADGAVYPLSNYAPGGDAREYMTDQGTAVAPYVASFQSTLKVDNFSLSFMLTGKFGHKFRRTGFNYASMAGGNTFVNKYYSEVKNADPNTMIPIPENEARYYFYDRYYPYMSYLTEDASHIRLQEVNLSYNLSKGVCSKIGLNGVRFYVQGNNLGNIFFNEFDEDPEFPLGGYKLQSSYTVGLNIKL